MPLRLREDCINTFHSLWLKSFDVRCLDHNCKTSFVQTVFRPFESRDTPIKVLKYETTHALRHLKSSIDLHHSDVYNLLPVSDLDESLIIPLDGVSSKMREIKFKIIVKNPLYTPFCIRKIIYYSTVFS